MKDEFKAITQEWIKKAQSDYGFANASFEEFDDFYSQMCVLCHDAGEKYLKGFIASHGIKPDRTHDLLNLLNICLTLDPKSKNLSKLKPSCTTLNNYYIPLKYPSHFPNMTKEQAHKALKSANIIGKTIVDNLKL